MTEKAVERMAAEIHDATGTRFSRCWSELDEGERAPWRRAARAALTSHPAVEVLRDLVESRILIDSADTEQSEWIKASKRHVEAEDRARTVLASLPKEK